MGDHEIDLVDTEQDDAEGGENAEIWREVDHFSDEQVFGYPDNTGGKKNDITDHWTGPKESPHAELPENKEPFQEGVGVGYICVTGLPVIDKVIAKGLTDQAGYAHEK
jgi:hypothetical protein